MGVCWQCTIVSFFFFNDTATTEIYTLSLHDALPISGVQDFAPAGERGWGNRIASRYWGMTPQEYYDAAGLWPLDPEGNILLRSMAAIRCLPILASSSAPTIPPLPAPQAMS